MEHHRQLFQPVSVRVHSARLWARNIATLNAKVGVACSVVSHLANVLAIDTDEHDWVVQRLLMRRPAQRLLAPPTDRCFGQQLLQQRLPSNKARERERERELKSKRERETRHGTPRTDCEKVLPDADGPTNNMWSGLPPNR